MNEIQWCEHLKINTYPVLGYGIAHIFDMGVVLVVGQGKVRVVCERCIPKILNEIQKSGHLVCQNADLSN